MTNAASQAFFPKFEFAFTVRINLSRPRFIRPSTMGAERAAIYAESGDFEGPNIRGIVVPMSGGDFPLVRPDGVIDFDARYLLETDDGALIYLQNRGFRWAPPDVAERMRANAAVDPSEYYMRVSPKFDVPAGRYEWLAKHIFVGVGEKLAGANAIHYFMLL